MQPDDDAQRANARHATRRALPDFCASETTLRVVLFAAGAAIVLQLYVGAPDFIGLMLAIGPVLLFVLWVVVGTMTLLCALSRWLSSRPWPLAVSIVGLIPAMLVVLVWLLAEWVGLADSDRRAAVWVAAAIVISFGLHYLHLETARRRELRAMAAAREQAMRARVAPHFVFNAMNSLAELTRTDPPRAERMAQDLAALFRATFQEREVHSLVDELVLVRRFLAIEQLRFGERLRVEWKAPDPLPPAIETLTVPVLSLQPLVENALQHGVAPFVTPAPVRIALRLDAGRLWIEISNGCRGGAGFKSGFVAALATRRRSRLRLSGWRGWRPWRSPEALQSPSDAPAAERSAPVEARADDASTRQPKAIEILLSRRTEATSAHIDRSADSRIGTIAGTGTGTRAVLARLREHFGAQAVLNRRLEDGRCIVELSLPTPRRDTRDVLYASDE
ncbi:MAG: sensor histidine kinase [Thioalkalivibrionaceae bacterium]